MKTINNFFVKIGYGIGIFWYFVFFIIYYLASTIGLWGLFLYFVFLPFNSWPEVETVKDLSDILKQYAMGISVLLITGPKWWEDKETKEAITMWHFIGIQIGKAGADMDKWYNSKIKK